MCKGGGSPPVPSAASTTFNSTVTPNPPAGALYTDFLNRANALSNTPFNPAMLGQVAPFSNEQTFAGNQLYQQGLDMGNFDPAKVQSMMSPFTESVVNATQNWFNNQNAIQGNDLLSQAIRSGNAFGGDRAGVAEGILAGQQQLAQAPVIAGLRQAGYTQALDEYNKLKQFGLQGAGAALGWGGLEQAQAQRVLDVNQQNAMMQSAYPFQTLNWYGSILGGIAPLLGTTASGSNNPPTAGGTGLGAASAAVGLGTAALGAFGGGGGGPAGAGWRGGNVRNFDRGGIVGYYDDGGDVFGSEPLGGPSDIAYRTDDDDDRPSRRDETPPPAASSTRLPPTTATSAGSAWGRNVGQLKTAARQLPQPILPQTGGGGSTTQPKSELEGWLGVATKAIPLATSLIALSDPKTKTDIQRVGRTDDGEPLYGFRYKGDPKSYPKVVGPMATPRADGGRVPYRNPYEGARAAPGDYRRTPGMAESEYRPYDFTDEEMKGIERSASRNTIDVPHHLIPFGTYMRHWDHFRNRQLNDDPEGEYEMSPRQLKQRGYAWGGYIPHLANGGDTDEPLTMTDLGVLSEGGNELPANIAGPVRGSPAGINPVQASDMSNLERVRERFRPRLENDPALARKFDINTTAEVGTRPLARDFYQALTLDRAASRGEDLARTLSPRAGYYPPETLNATRASGMGVSPILWGGANPANFATGNASYDPRTGRWVGFARGPQTGSVQTGSGTETGGIEGPDLPFMRRVGYGGPSRTAIGSAGPQGTGDVGSASEVDERERPSTGPATRSSGERTGSTQPGLRSGETKDVPSLAKPPPTFAQRLATNPFWQFGTALMAKPGIKGREGQAIGSALQSMSAQQLTERNRVLDEKPTMIKRDDGSIGFLTSEGKYTQLFGPGSAEGRATAADKRAQELHERTMATPTKEGDVYDPNTKKFVPTETTNPNATYPGTGHQTPQPSTPQTPPAPTVPPSAPSVTAPQIRQGAQGFGPALQRSQEERIAAGEAAAAGTSVAQTAAAPPAAAPPAAGPGGGPGGGVAPAPRPDEPLTDEQKDTAAQVNASGGFKTPLRQAVVTPRMLREFNNTPEGFDFRAAQLALGDDTVLKNLGNSGSAGKYKSALRQRAAEYWMERGLGPEDAMKAVAEFGAMKSGAKTLANAEARVTLALQEAKAAAPAVIAASAKVSRTDYPVLNSVIIAANKQTGGTDVIQLGVSTETLISAYAAALGRGSNVVSDTMRRHARELLEQGFSHNQMQAAVQQMMTEMDLMQRSTKNSMGIFMGGGQKQQPGGGPAAAPANPNQPPPGFVIQ